MLDCGFACLYTRREAVDKYPNPPPSHPFFLFLRNTCTFFFKLKPESAGTTGIYRTGKRIVFLSHSHLPPATISTFSTSIRDRGLILAAATSSSSSSSSSPLSLSLSLSLCPSNFLFLSVFLGFSNLSNDIWHAQ